MTRTKWLVSAALAAFLVLAVNSRSHALDAKAVDAVRRKSVLAKEDMQIIDAFLDAGVTELLEATKFAEIARVRTTILSRQSSQKQYAEQFSQSAYNRIMAGLQKAQTLPEEQKLKVTINLLMLINGMADAKLTKLPEVMLQSKSMVVRYWAVHSLTNPELTKKLNSGGQTGLQLARGIAEKLKGLVDTAKPEITALIARFAGDVSVPQGEELLLRIADMRIKQYAVWKVDYELLDGTVLSLLAGKIVADSANKSVLANRFGQLYSCVIQRFIWGKAGLSDTQKKQLASVIVGTEAQSIDKLLGTPQTAIKRAVERGDDAMLSAEHDKLLGTDAAAGALPAKLNFTYGPDSSGKKHKGPLALPPPPISPAK